MCMCCRLSTPCSPICAWHSGLALTKYYSTTLQRNVSEDELPDLLTQNGALLYEARGRELDPAGVVTETVSIMLRDRSGEYTFGLYDPARNSDLIYDPPLHTPASLAKGSAWEVTSKLAGSVDLGAQYRVLNAGGFASYNDCIQLQATTAISSAGKLISTATTRSWFCAQTGLVSSDTLNPGDPNGTPLASTRLISAATGEQADAASLPAPATVQDSVPAYQPEWQLAKVAQVLLSNETGESTIPPTWIPTDPPLILAAANNGDLVAFDASGTIAWRFHAGSDIYGPPAYDAAHGRIYFGASDRQLYALDARGLFLWRFAAGDNIATQPAIISNLVIFGSEDHFIYAVDAHSGVLRWQKSHQWRGGLFSCAGYGRPHARHRLRRRHGLRARPSQRRPTLVVRYGWRGGGARRHQPVGRLCCQPRRRPLRVGRRYRRVALAQASLATRCAQRRPLQAEASTSWIRAITCARSTGKRASSFGKAVRSIAAARSCLGEQVLVASASNNVDLLNADGHTTGKLERRRGRLRLRSHCRRRQAVWLSDNAATLWRIGSPGAQVQALASAWSLNPLYDAPFTKGLLLNPAGRLRRAPGAHR